MSARVSSEVRGPNQTRTLHAREYISPIIMTWESRSIREDGGPCRAIEQFVCDWWVLSVILRSIFAEFR
jgi:hypothetical protein